MPPLPAAGKKQPAAADKQKKETKGKKKNAPKKGTSGKKGGSNATARATREETAKLEHERKTAREAT